MKKIILLAFSVFAFRALAATTCHDVTNMYLVNFAPAANDFTSPASADIKIFGEKGTISCAQDHRDFDTLSTRCTGDAKGSDNSHVHVTIKLVQGFYTQQSAAFLSYTDSTLKIDLNGTYPLICE